MRISCPNCGAPYEVPASSIGAGRTVRCVECKNPWWQTPVDGGAIPTEAGRDATVRNDDPGTTAEPTTVAAIADVGDAGPDAGVMTVIEDDDVETDVDPETVETGHDGGQERSVYGARRGIRLYDVIGLAFSALCVGAVFVMLYRGPAATGPVRSPVISVLSTTAVNEGRGMRVLMSIVNPTGSRVAVPAISVSIDGSDGRRIARRELSAPVATLDGGGRTQADVVMPTAGGGTRLRVGFARN